MPPRRRFLCLLALAAFAAGCSRKEITSLQRKQAASYASEAGFAMTLRDYVRAEGLLAQAVAACPDQPQYWLDLGSARRRLGNTAGARQAYQELLDVLRDAYKRDPKDPHPLVQQVFALVLLRRMDDAQAVLDKLRRNHGDNADVRAFLESHPLERLTRDPTYKEIAL